MFGRFLNAFSAGVTFLATIITFVAHQPTLFLVNGALTGINVALYFHKEKEDNAR